MKAFKDSEKTDWVSLGGVRQEYVTSKPLTVRTEFYRQFGEKEGICYQWLFDLLPLNSGFSVLDLGCGTGELWVRNRNKSNLSIKLILGDASFNMLQDAANKVGNYWNVI